MLCMYKLAFTTHKIDIERDIVDQEVSDNKSAVINITSRK